jgi:type I restriction enzyme S subunit
VSPAAKKVAGVPDELTAGWKIRQIQEVAEINPRIDKRAIPDDIQVSFVPMPAVQAESGEIDVSQTKLAKEVKKGFTAFLQGDVLFAKITPCMENGKMAIAPTLVNGYGFGSTEFHVLRPREGLDAKYLYYYVSSKSFRGEAEGFMTGAVGQKRVSTTYIKEATIPVASLEDQRRIVAEIEKQFSRLDEAVASLKRVKANLKRYKAAVLKAAVEGKLTEEWRKQNPDVEPASKLLERILIERRAKWEEAELAKMKTKGKEPKNDKWKSHYKEPIKRNGKAGPFPATWTMCTVDEVLREPMCNGLSVKGNDIPPGIKALKLNAITPNGIDYKYVRYLSVEKEKVKNIFLARNDFLVVRGNGTLAFVGRGAIVATPTEPVIFPDTAIRLRFCEAIAETGWMPLSWQSFAVREQIESSAKTTAGIWKIAQNDIRAYEVTLPPIDEQKLIVNAADQKISLIESIEHQLEKYLLKSTRLRSSILRQSFTGGSCE